MLVPVKLLHMLIWAIMAARYMAQQGASFDIYLPKWLARYNKLIFGTIFVIGLFLVVANRLTRR